MITMQSTGIPTVIQNTMPPVTIPQQQQEGYKYFKQGEYFDVKNYLAQQKNLMENMGFTPDKMALLQSELSQLTPQNIQLATQLLKDPKVREQARQFETLLKNGQLTPEIMAQMMKDMPALMPLPPQIKGATKQHIAESVIIAAILGSLLGLSVDRLMNDLYNKNNGFIEKALKKIEKLSVVQTLNDNIEKRLKPVKPGVFPVESPWLRMDGAYTAEEVIKNYLSTYIGPKGHIYRDLEELIKKSGIKNKTALNNILTKLSKAGSHQNLSDVINSKEFKELIPVIARNSKGKKIVSLLEKLLKRIDSLEKFQMQDFKAEYQLSKTLKCRKIRPIGRFIAKMGYYLQKTLAGSTYKQKVPGFLSSSIGRLPVGRIFISVMVFSFAVAGFLRAEKGARISNFMDNIASGLGGYWGYEFGQAFIQQCGILTHNPKIAKFCLTKRGGFISKWIIPAMFASITGYISQKIARLFFGNPQKITEQKLFEADKNRPLKSQKNLFEDMLKNRDFSKVSNPALSSVINTATNSLNNEITPENIGLTLSQIENNPVAERENTQIKHFMEHNKDFEKQLWGMH